MKILLTGATGYIGKKLLTVLLNQGHHVICCIRDRSRFEGQQNPQVRVWEHDFLNPVDLNSAPQTIDAAYFLIHSMDTSLSGFHELEAQTARNFVNYMNETTARQIIYLGGITNQENLSKHLSSRKNVESILDSSHIPLTTLKAGIIIGPGSASFEIMRDLVEKLPILINPAQIYKNLTDLNTNQIYVPLHGCFKNSQQIELNEPEVGSCRKRIWSIGGENGWYYANFLWKIRGLIDKLLGGVGMRRTSNTPSDLQEGDPLDFWSVLLAE